MPEEVVVDNYKFKYSYLECLYTWKFFTARPVKISQQVDPRLVLQSHHASRPCGGVREGGGYRTKGGRGTFNMRLPFAKPILQEM